MSNTHAENKDLASKTFAREESIIHPNYTERNTLLVLVQGIHNKNNPEDNGLSFGDAKVGGTCETCGESIPEKEISMWVEPVQSGPGIESGYQLHWACWLVDLEYYTGKLAD